jgi:hypothetical protein
VHLIDGAMVETGNVVLGATITEAGFRTVSDGSSSININKGDPARSPSRTVNFNITNVNDAPKASDATIAVDEGTGETVSTPPTNPASIKVMTTAILAVTDSDDTVSGFDNGGGGHGYYTITLLPGHGSLYLNGVKITATGTQFSYAQLNSGQLEYRHDGSESAPYGNVDTFKYDATDPHAATGNVATVTIDIRPVNDPPLVTGTLTATVPEGGAAHITDIRLGAATTATVDPDNSANQVQYRITDVGSLHGQLYLGSADGSVITKTLGVGSAFTLGDIQAGILWYQHDGTESIPYSNTATFGFKISDSSGMNEPTGTFTITIIPVNDAPVVTGLVGGATFTEGDTGGTPNVIPILVDSSVALTDSDLANNNADFHGGSLTIAYAVGGSNVTDVHDQLAIKNIGGAGQIGVSGSTISFNNIVIGSIDATENGLNGHALKINFDGTASSLTIPAIKALIQDITFYHSEYDNAVTGTRTLNYTLVDGGGRVSPTDDRNRTFNGYDTWTGSATVTVVAANDRPVLTAHTGGGNLNLGTIT